MNGIFSKLVVVIASILACLSLIIFIVFPPEPKRFDAAEWREAELNYRRKIAAEVVKLARSAQLEDLTLWPWLLIIKLRFSEGEFVEPKPASNNVINSYIEELSKQAALEDTGIILEDIIDNLRKLITYWEPDERRIESGRKLYGKHCMSCHGADGRNLWESDTTAAPRDLSGRSHAAGRLVFKFTTTGYGELPTDDDLMRTIKNGIPGTRMYPFNHLNQHEIYDILQYIKTFQYLTWRYGRIPRSTHVPQPSVDLRAGEVIDSGRKLYLVICKSCHGDVENGGPPSAPVRSEWHKNDSANGDQIEIPVPDIMRDTFKRGYSNADLFLTVKNGVGGAMPSNPQLTDKEIWQLVSYILYLRKLSTDPGLRSGASGGKK